MRRSALVPRPITTPGRAERVPDAVDLQKDRRSVDARWCRARSGCGRHRGRCPTPHPEPAGGELVRAAEVELDGSGEEVVLRLGVLVKHGSQLARQRLAVRGQAIEVRRRQVDLEVVRGKSAVPAEDLGGVVDLTLEGSSDLHRLYGAAKGSREGTCHQMLETLLEAVQRTHRGNLISSLCRGLRTSSRHGPAQTGTSSLALDRSRNRAAGTVGRGSAAKSGSRRVLASESLWPGSAHSGALVTTAALRAGGGIGRRARFRSVCPKGRGVQLPLAHKETAVQTSTSAVQRQHNAVYTLNRPLARGLTDLRTVADAGKLPEWPSSIAGARDRRC